MNAPGELLCFFAVGEEARPFRRLLRDRSGPRVEITGIGPRKARAAASRALAQRHPALVLTCGFAGGLNPAWPRGTVIYAADEGFPLGDALRAAGAVSGRFFGSERIVVAAAEKAGLWRRTGADAVEMESEVIRCLCRERGVPSATVRVISDAAAEDLPLDFNRMSSPDFELSYGRLALALARRPGKVLELLKFRRALGEAASRLAAVLSAATSNGPSPRG